MAVVASRGGKRVPATRVPAPSARLCGEAAAPFSVPRPRLYGNAMPKKMKQVAIRSVFADRAQADRIRILDAIKIDEIKTKSILNMLTNFELSGKKCLILDEGSNENCAALLP